MKKILLAIAILVSCAMIEQPKANAYPAMCAGTWYGWIYTSPAGSTQYYEGCSGEEGQMDWYRVSYGEFWLEVIVDGMQVL